MALVVVSYTREEALWDCPPETLLEPQAGPLPGNLPGTRKETARELSAKAASKSLIQDEMRPCLCTSNFPPKWRVLSITQVFQ